MIFWQNILNKIENWSQNIQNNKKPVNLYDFSGKLYVFPVEIKKNGKFPVGNVYLVDYLPYRTQTLIDEDYLRLLVESKQVVYDGCIYSNKTMNYYFILVPPGLDRQS